VGNKSFYSLTPKSVKLLEEGAQRIFQPRADEWDGKWCLLTYSIPEKKRSLRNKLREKLTWLGYAPLNNATWISPRILRHKLEDLLDSLKIRDYVEIFCAEHLGFSSNQEVVDRCWDLEGLNQTYADFIAKYEPLLNEHKTRLAEGNGLDPSECFVQRFMLVHEYRSFPYVDPNLPTELLPNDWLGDQAIQLFREYHELLTAGANALVDDVFARAPSPGK
jgi:phenylacetic acid degradation operon negative regulatory protein